MPKYLLVAYPWVIHSSNKLLANSSHAHRLRELQKQNNKKKDKNIKIVTEKPKKTEHKIHANMSKQTDSQTDRQSDRRDVKTRHKALIILTTGISQVKLTISGNIIQLCKQKDGVVFLYKNKKKKLHTRCGNKTQQLLAVTFVNLLI